MNLPQCETLKLECDDGVLRILLNRPKARNALNDQMVNELMDVLSRLKGDRRIRAVVLRGAEGHFCAGADLKGIYSADKQTVYKSNRRFGDLISTVNTLEQVVIAAIEGSVLGGGFGMACASDMAISTQDARFAMPETGLGIPPAQIAPFVVTRIGITQARSLALMGARVSGEQALTLGIVHQCVPNAAALDAAVDQALSRVKHCAPEANASTKALMLSIAGQVSGESLDYAAQMFTDAVTSGEGKEGLRAFTEKRAPSWAIPKNSEAGND